MKEKKIKDLGEDREVQYDEDLIHLQLDEDIEFLGEFDSTNNQEIEDVDLVPYAVTDFLPIGIDENDAVQQAISNSLNRHEQLEDDVCEDTNDLPALSSEGFMSLIKQHADAKVHGEPRNIVVSQLSIAESYFKRKGFLNGSGTLQVAFATFEGEEDAANLGGPRREFFHLLLGAISRDSGTLINTPSGHVVRCNVGALQGGKFAIVGKMLATMVVQGGEFPHFSNSICQYIQAGFENSMPVMEEVPDKNVRDSLNTVHYMYTKHWGNVAEHFMGDKCRLQSCTAKLGEIRFGCRSI